MTRAVPQARSLLEAIVAAGGTPIALPLLDIVDADDGGASLRTAVEGLGSQDWLVVLSPNGVRHLPQRSSEDRFPGKVAAIASGTKRALAEGGYDVDLLPDVASSVGLLAAFEHVEVSGRVLIAQAEHGRRELADGLAERGVAVDVVTAYRNVMPHVDEARATEARGASLVVFASPSAVNRYGDHVGTEPSQAVCIGSVTAAEATAAGFDVVVAESPNIEAIVEALVVSVDESSR